MQQSLATIRRLVAVSLLALTSCSGLDAVGGPQPDETLAGVTTSTTSDVTTSSMLTTTSQAGQVAPEDSIVEPPATAELDQAIRSAVEVSGPYGYLTVTPICDGCDPGAEVQLYLTPSAADALVRVPTKAWIDGAESTVPDEIWAVDPVAVPELLLAAIDAGQGVDWTIDGSTFLVRSWSIDGIGATYPCYQVDTAPLDLRSKDCSGGWLGRG